MLIRDTGRLKYVALQISNTVLIQRFVGFLKRNWMTKSVSSGGSQNNWQNNHLEAQRIYGCRKRPLSLFNVTRDRAIWLGGFDPSIPYSPNLIPRDIYLHIWTTEIVHGREEIHRSQMAHSACHRLAKIAWPKISQPRYAFSHTVLEKCVEIKTDKFGNVSMQVLFQLHYSVIIYDFFLFISGTALVHVYMIVVKTSLRGLVKNNRANKWIGECKEWRI